MVNKQRKSKAEVNVIGDILRLIKKNVPVLFLWMHKGELKKIGTHNMLDWFESLPENSKKQLSSDMVRDLMAMNNQTEELLLNPDNIPASARASTLYKSVTEVAHSSGIPELPWPLTLMSKKQLVKYVSDLCADEAKKDGARLIYGGEVWRPSFWLEELWSWSHLKTGLWKTKESMYTGPGKWSDFLSRTIMRLFELKGLDPEKHVEDLKGKTKVLDKKKRIRGVHEPVKISRQPSLGKQQSQVLQTSNGDVHLTDNAQSGSDALPSAATTSLLTSPVPVASLPRDSLPPPLVVFCSAPEVCMCAACTSPFLLQGPQDQFSIPEQDDNFSQPGTWQDIQGPSHTEPTDTSQPGSRQDGQGPLHTDLTHTSPPGTRQDGQSPSHTEPTHTSQPGSRQDGQGPLHTELTDTSQPGTRQDRQDPSHTEPTDTRQTPPGHLSINAPRSNEILKPRRTVGKSPFKISGSKQPDNLPGSVSDRLVVPIPISSFGQGGLLEDPTHTYQSKCGEPPQCKILRARSAQAKMIKFDKSKRKGAGLKIKSDSRKQIILSERRMCKKKNAQNDSNGSFVSKPFVVKEFIKDINDSGVAMKSDIYHVFPFAQTEPSLSDLLAPPTESEREKEAFLDKMDVEIKDDTVKSDIEMKRVEKVINVEKAKQKSWRKRLKGNRILRKQMEAEMSQSLTKELFHKNMEYITNIYSGAQSSARRAEFMKGGIFRDRLRGRMITSPFNDTQLDVVLDEMEKLWMTNKKEKMENSDFIWKVCLPETLIKVQCSGSVL